MPASSEEYKIRIGSYLLDSYKMVNSTSVNSSKKSMYRREFKFKFKFGASQRLRCFYLLVGV